MQVNEPSPKNLDQGFPNRFATSVAYKIPLNPSTKCSPKTTFGNLLRNLLRSTPYQEDSFLVMDADPQNFQELNTFAIWFYVGGLQKSFLSCYIYYI